MDPVLRWGSKDARFSFIEAEQNRFGVKRLCKYLRVSKAGFYLWRKRPPNRHALDDSVILEKVRDIFNESKTTYGSPRVHRRLRQIGVRVGRKRVARLMRQHHLKARAATIYRRSPGTTRYYCRTPNRTIGLTTTAPNQVLVGDVTYLKYATTQVYLAGILDRHSRRVLGRSLGHKRDLALTRGALDQAIETQPPLPGTIFHSDRGAEFVAYAFTARLDDCKILPSTNRPREITDNAFMESFWHSFKSEAYHGFTFNTEAQLLAAIDDFIYRYNNTRLHSSLDYRSPVEYERDMST